MISVPDSALTERRPLPRLYAHYHRLLIDLLEDLAQNARVVWLTGEEGHIRRPDGEANTYRKALYAVEELSPYGARLEVLASVRREGQEKPGVKRPGLLLPGTQIEARHVVLSRSETWSSHALTKEVVAAKLEAFTLKTRESLRAFEVYASKHDPRREKVEREFGELENARERLAAWDETTLRERARGEKHTARVLVIDPLTGEEESQLHYVRDVGLIVAGPGLTERPEAIQKATMRKRRVDRMEGKLEPLVRFGNFEVFSEQQWQTLKGS